MVAALPLPLNAFIRPSRKLLCLSCSADDDQELTGGQNKT